MPDASIGRPRRKPALQAHELVTAEGVTPAVTAGQLHTLRDRMGCRTQQEFAEQFAVTQATISYLLGGTMQLKPGPLHTLIVDRLREHRVRA